MTPGGVLALDLSSRTGWCYGLAGEAPRTGVWALRGISNPGATYAGLCDQLADAITLFEPGLVVMEAPLPPHAQTAMATARQQFGLASTVELVCYRRDIRVLEQSAIEVRKLMMGRGRGVTKGDVVTWCTERGWPVQDHNAGDAVVLWAYALQMLTGKARAA